jgi:Ca-activated chloride channel family protein
MSRRRSKVTIALLGLVAVTLAAVPAVGQSSPQAFLLILDGSGSMWGQIEGTAKIQIAKQTLTTLIDGLPADALVGFMAYGHRRDKDCDDVELVVPVGPLDKENL